MKRLSEYIKWYLYITISILMVTTISFMAEGVDSLPAATLWQIQLSGLLTTLVTVLIVYKETHSMAGALIKFVLHYLALCAVMILCGNWFGWLSLNIKGVMTMVLSVGVVYILAFGIFWMIDIKQAKDINKKLKERFGEEE